MGTGKKQHPIPGNLDLAIAPGGVNPVEIDAVD
jgi:hypothetical protein